MKKRLLSAVLAMCMMLCSAAALPENSFAQSSDIAASAASLPITGKCGDNVKWSLSDGNLTIVGTGKMYNYTNSVPSPFHDYVDSITSIVIKSGVTNIGDRMFYGCQSLRNVTIPSSVTSIGNQAFSYCTNIYNVNIPNSVTSIGNYAFSNCSSLKDIAVTSSVTNIGNYAFAHCSSFKTISIPNGVVNIGSQAFYDCENLTSVVIPSSVKRLGRDAFYACTKLSVISIPSTLTNIGGYAFTGTEWLKTQQKHSPLVVVNNILIDGSACSGKVTIPSGVRYINEHAFDNDLTYSHFSTVTSISIPDTVTKIGDNAFRASELTSMTIPKSVTSIGTDAFAWCTDLTDINVDPDNKQFSSVDGVVYNKSKTELIVCPNGKRDVTILPTVTKIRNYAFHLCLYLTSVTIPESVESIGKMAFNNTGIRVITLRPSVTSIGSKALGYSDDTKEDKYTIRCFKGTAAEKYAADNGLTTRLLDGIKHYPAKAETCTQDGNIEYWTLDGKYYLNDIATTSTTKDTVTIKARHKRLTGVSAKAPTCTENGNEPYWYCTTCKKCFSDSSGRNEITLASTVIEPIGHALAAVAAKPATCTANGNIAYWYCTRCQKYFSDKNGKNELFPERTILYATGHKFSGWTTTAFNVEKGTSTMTRKCTVCQASESKTVKDAVIRLAGADRYATAAEISGASFTGKSDTVILAYGLNYADALAGVPLAVKLSAPILLTAKDSLPDATLTEIRRLGATKAIILGGTAVISEKVEKILEDNKLKTERIAGKTRFETAVKIAEKMQEKDKKAPVEVFFVYGLNYADALSVSPIAARLNAPVIYLTTSGSLNADTAAYLAKLKKAGTVKIAYVIGGTSVISDDMMEIAGDALGVKPIRAAGANRFETCAALNDMFKSLLYGNMLCIATGMDFPDALTGGVYAAKNNAPLFLINGKAKTLNLLDKQKAYLKQKRVDKITTFGGTSAVPNAHVTVVAKHSV